MTQPRKRNTEEAGFDLSKVYFSQGLCLATRLPTHKERKKSRNKKWITRKLQMHTYVTCYHKRYTKSLAANGATRLNKLCDPILSILS